MKRLLITAERVIASAFGGCDYIPANMVDCNSIISAQRRFMLPILGEELIAAVTEGEYGELYEEYIEPAMAQYTRVEMTPIEDPNRKAILRQARALARRLSDHLEDNAASYAEYKSEQNVLRRIRIYGTSIEHR